MKQASCMIYQSRFMKYKSQFASCFLDFAGREMIMVICEISRLIFCFRGKNSSTIYFCQGAKNILYLFTGTNILLSNSNRSILYFLCPLLHIHFLSILLY